MASPEFKKHHKVVVIGATLLSGLIAAAGGYVINEHYFSGSQQGLTVFLSFIFGANTGLLGMAIYPGNKKAISLYR